MSREYKRFVYTMHNSKVTILEKHKHPFDIVKYKVGDFVREKKEVNAPFDYEAFEFDPTLDHFEIQNRKVRCVMAKNRQQAIRYLKRRWRGSK